WPRPRCPAIQFQVRRRKPPHSPIPTVLYVLPVGADMPIADKDSSKTLRPRDGSGLQVRHSSVPACLIMHGPTRQPRTGGEADRCRRGLAGFEEITRTELGWRRLLDACLGVLLAVIFNQAHIRERFRDSSRATDEQRQRKAFQIVTVGADQCVTSSALLFTRR